MIAAGTIVDGRYEIISLLGEGGMCAVYKARHLEMQRDVALKILHVRLLTEGNAVERFRREAIAVNELSHPNIVKVYGFGLHECTPYMAMEFLEGVSLALLLSREKRLPAEKAMPIFDAILAGLEHAHCKGILHRDLKPSNVMLVGEDRSVRLVDFGLAKILPETGKQMQKITQTGELFGTVTYMSPEQCSGEPLDVRSDLYSMGCLMYEVLDGQPPLRGDSAFATLSKHLTQLPGPSDYIKGDWSKVIFACLDKDPQRRPASAWILREALRHPGTFSYSRRWNRSGLMPSRLTPRIAAFVAVGVLAIGGLITALSIAINPSNDNKDPGMNQMLAKQHFDAGIKAGDNNQHQIAINEYTTAIHYDPKIAEAYFRRGIEYGAVKRLDDALKDFNTVINDLKNPWSSMHGQHETFQRRGGIELDMSHLDLALADYTAAIKVKPDEETLYRDRANVYILMKRLPEAWQDIAAAERNSQSTDVWVIAAKALAYDAQGDHRKAYDTLTEAIAMFAHAEKDGVKDDSSGGHAVMRANLAEAYKARAKQAELLGNQKQAEQDRAAYAHWIKQQ